MKHLDTSLKQQHKSEAIRSISVTEFHPTINLCPVLSTTFPLPPPAHFYLQKMYFFIVQLYLINSFYNSLKGVSVFSRILKWASYKQKFSIMWDISFFSAFWNAILVLNIHFWILFHMLSMFIQDRKSIWESHLQIPCCTLVSSVCINCRFSFAVIS